MKIGVVSDVHGNAKAMLKAFELMGEVDELFCLGDCISQYRFSNEVVEILRERNVHTILGNHEEVFFSPLGERARAAAWIDQELMGWLGSQPHRKTLNLAGKELLLIHSTPWSPGGEYICANDRQFPRFGETGADFLFYGHTHTPVVQKVGSTVVINPGSTGEARYTEGRLEMSCALLDLATHEAQVICFPEER